MNLSDLFDVIDMQGHDLGQLNSPFMIRAWCQECGGWVWTIKKDSE